MTRAHEIVYLEFKADLRLTDYIKSYWYFRVQTETTIPFDILPDGYFDLLIVIKGNRIVSSKLTGIWSKRVSVNYSENTEVIGIRFKPLSIGSLLKLDVKETLDGSQVVVLEDFNLNEQVLLDVLFGFPGFPVNYLNRQFLELVQTTKTDRRLKKCFDLVDTSIGNITVGKLSETIGLSTRQLHRKVTGMIGIGIKDYSRIVRFRKVLRDVKSSGPNSIYYYDQSHFIREVRQFTGLTPGELDLDNNKRLIQYYNFK